MTSAVTTIIRDVVFQTNPGNTESGERVVALQMAVGPAETPTDQRAYILTKQAAIRLAAGLLHAVLYEPEEVTPDEPVEAPEG